MDGRDFLGRPWPTTGCRAIYDDDADDDDDDDDGRCCSRASRDELLATR